MIQRAHPALDAVDLALDRGITGLLGPNGAGKTTLLSILATVNEPDAGDVSIFGLNPKVRAERVQIRRQLGFLPQELGYHRHFTVAGFLDYVAILKEIVGIGGGQSGPACPVVKKRCVQANELHPGIGIVLMT